MAEPTKSAATATTLLVLLASAVTAPFNAVPVLLWAHLSGTPLRDLGLRRPRSWVREVSIGVTLGVLFKLAMKAVVMRLLGAPDANPAYGFLAGDTTAALAMIPVILGGAGFGEELVFRGFLFERLGRLLGRGRVATVATLALTAALFGAAHYPEQGVPGVQQAVVVGLGFGGLYARSRRLWWLMIAHAAFDLTAVALIYWRLEGAIAHAAFH